MKYYFILPLIISLIHLIGAYLRYLPFSKVATGNQKRTLFILIVFWNFCVFFMLQLCKLETQPLFSIYKQLVLFGVLPYFLFNIFVLKGPFYQHIFILGMQRIFSFSIHSLASILTLVVFEPMLPEYILVQAVFHLALQILFLPFSTKWFLELLLPFYEGSSNLMNYTIAFIPLLAVSSHWSMVFTTRPEVVYVYLSRLTICCCFFLFYQYCWLREREIYEEELRREENFFMLYQIEALNDYTQQIMESQNQMIQIRHDSRHWIRMLSAMLQSKKYDLAKEVLQNADVQLDNTRVYFYCLNPVVNAALSIYFSRSKKYGIQLQHSINVPASLPGMDNDVAILLSNLLDNAIHASLQGEAPNPYIRLNIQTKGSQILLHMENTYIGKLTLDTEGFPLSPRRTMSHTKVETLKKIAETEKRKCKKNVSYLEIKHGIGNLSIKSFIKKYSGYYNISQENDVVTVFIYWSFKKDAS